MNFFVQSRKIFISAIMNIGIIVSTSASTSPVIEKNTQTFPVVENDQCYAQLIEFETLLDAAFDTKKSSFLARGFFDGFLRESIKIVASLSALCSLNQSGRHGGYMLPEAALVAIPLLADGCFATADNFFSALSGIEEYVKTLTPEQQKACFSVFKKYEDKLHEKILRQEDGIGINMLKYCRLCFDIIFLASLCGGVLLSRKNAQGVDAIITIGLMVAADIPQILSNAFKDRDAEKTQILRNIKSMLRGQNIESATV
ncbi:MAG: hypothetical protein WC365_03265 [Candidatus Babeliales bacterium]|jgi:hypothetical protein